MIKDRYLGISSLIFNLFLSLHFYLTFNITIMNFDFNAKLNELLGEGVHYLPNLVSGILLLLIGLWVIKIVMRAVAKVFTMREIDPTVQRFLVSLMDVILKVMLILSVASTLGVQTTSFLAILTSAGLAIGLALQGGLANFAGGVLILLFKPFKVGDKISAQGFTGDVEEISIFVTKLATNDRKTIIIPNGPLANGNIVNLSAKGMTRMEFKMTIPTAYDLEKIRQILIKAMAGAALVLKDPEPSVHVGELNGPYITLWLRYHCLPLDDAASYVAATEAVRNAIVANNIPAPMGETIVNVRNL